MERFSEICCTVHVLSLVIATLALLKREYLLALGIVIVFMGYLIANSFQLIMERPYQVSLINDETSGNTGIILPLTMKNT